MLGVVKVSMIAVVVALVAGVMGADGADVLQNYNMMKILNTCMGAATIEDFMGRLRDTQDRCLSLPLKANLLPAASRSPDGADAEDRQSAPRTPDGADAEDRQSSPRAADGADGSSAPMRKLSAYQYYDASRVRGLQQRMAAKASNETCVMKSLGYMDDSEEISYSNIVKDLEQVPIDLQLKRDLLEGVQNCKAIATCLPVNDIQVPYPPSLLRLRTFRKCFIDMHLLACYKKVLSTEDNFHMKYAVGEDQILDIIWDHASVGNSLF